MGIKFITYHHIIEKDNDDFYGVTIKLFKEHIEYMLGRGWDAVDIEDEEQVNRYRESNDKCGFVVTFDDGYKSQLQAIAEAKKYGCSPILFVPTCVLKNDILEANVNQVIIGRSKNNHGKVIDKLIDLLKGKENVEAGIIIRGLDNVIKKRYGTIEEAKIKYIIGKTQECVDLSDIPGIIFEDIVGDTIFSFFKNMYISKEEVIRLSESGVIIGGHGKNHIKLSTRFHSKRKIDEELETAYIWLKTLYRNMDVPIMLSFPYGAYDDYSKEKAKEIGYKYTYTTLPSDYTEHSERGVVPRFDANDITQMINQ